MIEDPRCRAGFVLSASRADRADAAAEAQDAVHVVGVEALQADGVVLRDVAGVEVSSRVASPFSALPGTGKPPCVDLDALQLAREVRHHRRHAARIETGVVAVRRSVAARSTDRSSSAGIADASTADQPGCPRRPVDTTQWVGCCLVSQMSKSISIHSGGLSGPGGRLGDRSARHSHRSNARAAWCWRCW